LFLHDHPPPSTSIALAVASVDSLCIIDLTKRSVPALVQEVTSTRPPQHKQEKKCAHLLAMMSQRGYYDSCVLLVRDLLSQLSGGRYCCGRVPAAGDGRVGGGAAERAAVGASQPLALAAAAALSVCFGGTGAERATTGASPSSALAAEEACAVVVGGRVKERAAVGTSPLPALAACDNA